jgi:hypothetical protein
MKDAGNRAGKLTRTHNAAGFPRGASHLGLMMAQLYMVDNQLPTG